jgi:uncharacterized membrane protein YsdA (DUF1294 family)
MFWDKLSAIKGRQRIAERTLLGWAYMGGAFGAKIGQKLFRHKTVKEPFRSHLTYSTYWNVALYTVLLITPLRETIIAFILQ